MPTPLPVCDQVHQYRVQAEVLHRSWVLDDAQMAFVHTLRDLERNEMKGTHAHASQSAAPNTPPPPPLLPPPPTHPPPRAGGGRAGGEVGGGGAGGRGGDRGGGGGGE